MTPQVFHYRVNHRLEVGFCEWCGKQIEIGHEAVDYQGEAFCSDTCALESHGIVEFEEGVVVR